LEIGATGKASLVVTDRDMASALAISDLDQFPEVFATSRMVALMEIAAARVMKPLLQPGQLSVGVEVSVRHMAATPKNTEVVATAVFLGMEGKLYKFRIEAHDPGGLIGEGEHTRAIIHAERLMQGADSRINAQP
jgi:fluoroacetyl-CoA thioesterase